MKKYVYGMAFTAILIGLCLSNADAKGYMGQQRTIEFSTDDLIAILDDQEISSPEDMAKPLFNTSVKALLEKAQNKGVSPEITKSTIYISDKKLRFDTDAPQGKMSQLMRLDEGKMYNIMWFKKQYMEMSIEDIRQMQAKAKDAMKQMGGMEGILDKLPPEARAKMEERMGGKAGGEGKSAARLQKTGQKKTINGFPCEEYLIDDKSERKQAWVSHKYPALRKAFDAMLTEFPSFDSSDKKDKKEAKIWKQIPDAWPVVMKEFEFNAFRGRASLEIQEMVSIEEKALSPDIFRVPKDFTRATMRDMMPGMMPGRK